MKTLLITSVGSGVGHNLLDCLEGRRAGLRVVGSNSEAAAAANFRCDRVHLAPPVADGSAWQAFHAELLRREGVDLVIPARDDDVLALARWRAQAPELGPRLLVGDLRPASALHDKAQYAAFAASQGLAFAPTLVCGRGANIETALQLWRQHGALVAKPAAGNGSRGVRIVHSAAQVRMATQTPGYVLQPYFDPHPEWRDRADETHLGLPLWSEVPETALYGFHALVDPQGRVDGSLGYRAVQTAGRPTWVEPCPEPELEALALAHVQALARAGWRGPCNVQLKRDPGWGWQVIEVNGRFTGASLARRLLGLDELGLCLRQWLGDAVLAMDPVRPTPSHADGGYRVERNDLATLQQSGVWP